MKTKLHTFSQFVLLICYEGSAVFFCCFEVPVSTSDCFTVVTQPRSICHFVTRDSQEERRGYKTLQLIGRGKTKRVFKMEASHANFEPGLQTLRQTCASNALTCKKQLREISREMIYPSQRDYNFCWTRMPDKEPFSVAPSDSDACVQSEVSSLSPKTRLSDQRVTLHGLKLWACQVACLFFLCFHDRLSTRLQPSFTPNRVGNRWMEIKLITNCFDIIKHIDELVNANRKLLWMFRERVKLLIWIHRRTYCMSNYWVSAEMLRWCWPVWFEPN